MKRRIRLTITVLGVLWSGLSGFAYGAEAADAGNDARMQWWHEAKFGMFIHWGVYSQAAGEWEGTTNHAEWLQFTAKIPIAEYTELAGKFKPAKFDADEWVGVAKDAGMKYLVITSKHHDGFAIYGSESDPYNIVGATPFKRDPLKELAEACRKQGIRFCVYYSLGRDWHDPDVPTGRAGDVKYPPGGRSNLIDFPDESKKDFAKYFERKVKPQVRELLTRYGPIGILWFDTPEKITKAQSAELRAMIRQLQPDCIVNARIGNGLGDYGTPEQEIPSGRDTKPWETCMTLNGHWGFNKADNKWKSTETLLRNLIDIASKGGNYLLNVGPTGEGVIPQASIDRLREIGVWLRVNGEAIYGTGLTPFGPEVGSFSATEKDKKGKPLFIPNWEWRCTTKPGKVFIHLFKWPAGRFVLEGLKCKVSKAYLLADRERPLTVTQDAGKLTVVLPGNAPDPIASVICLETDAGVR
jgi:alpha-L-fucosidase